MTIIATLGPATLTGSGATGRFELDARTATAYGVLRGFTRIDSAFGNSSSSQTGALNQLYNITAGPFPAKEQTIVNKAFVQFAGLTAGRAQSIRFLRGRL